MPPKPKHVANLETEKLARRMQALFPGAPNFYTVTYSKKQPKDWKLGDKFEIGYRRVPSREQLAAGTPGLPAPVSAYADHIDGRVGIVIPLCDVSTMSSRWGGVDIDVYDNPTLVDQIIERVQKALIGGVFLHMTKSAGLRLLLNYGCDVPIAETRQIIDGMAHKFGFAGIKYECFPPEQTFRPDTDPLQLNMPYFGDQFHVIHYRNAAGLVHMTLDQFLDRAEKQFFTTREYYAQFARDNPRTKQDNKVRKADKRRAATDLRRGIAYAEHHLKVYCATLETSVQGQSIPTKPGAAPIDGRNDMVSHWSWHMGTMVARGWIAEEKAYAAIEQATAIWGEDSSSRDKTLKTLRKQLAKGMDTPHDDLANIVPMTEDFAAMEFVSANIDKLRYDVDLKRYLMWSEELGYWALDDITPVFDMIRTFVREQTRDEPPKVQARIVTKSFTSAVEHHVRNSPAIRCRQSLWDSDPMLLGAPGCTIDLRSGGAREPRREDFISRITAIAPAETANCPEWAKLIHQIARGDEEYAKFLQLIAGYCLIGDNREHKMFFLHGYTAANGKGMFMETTGKVLGDATSGTGMHFAAPSGMFAASHNAKPTYDLASARHARLLTSGENSTDKFWDEEFIKMVTGGEKVSARGLYQNNSSFTPPFTPIFAGQSLPRLKNPDGGMKRRILICPFLMHATDVREEVDEAAWIFLKDVGLKERLDEELPGILRWIIDGVLLYRDHKFHKLPAIVSKATEEFFWAEDHLGRFMAATFVRTRNPADSVDAAEVYRRYKIVMEYAGQFPEPQAQITKKLKMKGYETKTVNGFQVFKNLRARAEMPPDRPELPI